MMGGSEHVQRHPGHPATRPTIADRRSPIDDRRSTIWTAWTKAFVIIGYAVLAVGMAVRLAVVIGELIHIQSYAYARSDITDSESPI